MSTQNRQDASAAAQRPAINARWVQPQPLQVRRGLWAGLIVALMTIPPVVARSPDWPFALLEAIAALVPFLLVAALAAHTNRRTIGPRDVPWSPPPSATPKG